MKVLTFTTLFPNKIKPNNAIFVYHRMAAVAKYHPVELKVIAPVPFFPPFRINKKWYEFSCIPKQENISGFDVFHPSYVVIPKIGMSLYGLSMFAGTLKTAKKLYKEFPFDIIDAHFAYPDALAAVLLGKYFKKPVVISTRGTDINLYTRFPLIKSLLRYALNSASHIISVCNDLKQIMLSMGVHVDISVIPNGIDPKYFKALPMNQCRKQLNLPQDRKIVLSVGSLTEGKGHHVLIKAVSHILESGERPPLLCILGSGPMRNNLEELITEYNLTPYVKLIEEVKNQELNKWYSAADLFCLATAREGWPNVVSESLSCGTPVVATAANGIPEIIISDQYGFLVSRTPDNFAEKIQYSLKHNWDRPKISKFGRQRSWKDVAIEVYSVFEQVTV